MRPAEPVCEIRVGAIEPGGLSQLIAGRCAVAKERRLERTLGEIARLSTLRVTRRRRGTCRGTRCRRRGGRLSTLQWLAGRRPLRRGHPRKDEQAAQRHSSSKGHFVTVTVAVPLVPPAVAVMVTVPSFFALTRPSPLTLAIAGSLEDQLNVRPLTGLPAASKPCAVSGTMSPIFIDDVAGVTRMLASGPVVTVTVEVPLFPPVDAVIVAVPTRAPVTTPLPETVAVAVLLDVHVMVRSVRTFPL